MKSQPNKSIYLIGHPDSSREIRDKILKEKGKSGKIHNVKRYYRKLDFSGQGQLVNRAYYHERE